MGASFRRLGAVADFLSKPILVGFLNGVSLYILVGQFGKLLGFSIAAPGLAPKLLEIAQRIGRWPWVSSRSSSTSSRIARDRHCPRRWSHWSAPACSWR
jgi:MFS superfamily sulfate permease-like transporter